MTMKNYITQFLEILSDNDYKALYKDIPDDMPNRDEFIADLQEIIDDDGFLPDSLRYFEVNGVSNPNELKKLLDYSFQEFKTDFIANNYQTNSDLIQDLSKRVNTIISDFKNHVQEGMSLKDEGLVDLYKIKFKFLEEVKFFLAPVTEDKKVNTTKNRKTKQYFFVVRKEFNIRFNAILQNLYQKLLVGGFIECKESEFKKLFYLETELQIAKTPKPVIWISDENKLAYFIKILNQEFLVKSNFPSKWDSATFLFHKNEIGEFFKDISQGERLKYDRNLREQSRNQIEIIVGDSIKDSK